MEKGTRGNGSMMNKRMFDSMKDRIMNIWTSIRMAALGIALAAVSCLGPVEPAPSDTALAQGDLVSFVAVLDQDITRTALDELNVCWSPGDRVRVFTAAYPAGVVYDLTGGAGTPAGTFTGPGAGDGPYYVVYPADAGIRLDGTAVHVTVPSVQTYAEGSFGAGANLSAGYATTLDNLRVRNLAGTLAVRFTGEKTLRSVRIHTLGSECLSGTAVVTGLDTDAPSLRFDGGQTDVSFRQVTLDCGSAGVPLSAEGKSFLVVLPAGSLAEGFFLEARDTEGKAMVRHSKADAAAAIVRSEIRPMPALAYTPRYKADFLQSGQVGAFAHADASADALVPLCRYVEGQSQYAYLNTPGASGSRYLRLEDWEDGYALGLTMPYVLAPGQDYSVTIQSLGSTGVSSGTVQGMRMVKRFGDRVWLYDAKTGNGYAILMIEEEE